MSVTANLIKTAIVTVSNSADETKKYDIVADVNVNNGTALSDQTTGQQITNGKVTIDDVTKATFSQYSKALNINYPNVDSEEQAVILAAVNAFILEAKEYIINVKIAIE